MASSSTFPPSFGLPKPKPSILERPAPIKPSDGELVALRKALKSCVDLLSCGVCLERLSDTVITCTNGHLVCGNCRRRLGNECPSCKEPLVPKKPVVLCKLLEALPGFCSNAGCEEVVTAKDVKDHELSCAERAISCRICHSSFKAKDIPNHSAFHTLLSVSGNSIKSSVQIDKTCSGGSKEGSSVQENNMFNKVVRLWSAHDEYFWIVETVNELSNSYQVEISWIPVKKTNVDEFQVTILIDPDSKQTFCESRQKITRSNDVMFSFSLQYLRRFIESGGCVVYQLTMHKSSFSMYKPFSLNFNFPQKS